MNRYLQVLIAIVTVLAGLVTIYNGLKASPEILRPVRDFSVAEYTTDYWLRTTLFGGLLSWIVYLFTFGKSQSGHLSKFIVGYSFGAEVVLFVTLFVILFSGIEISTIYSPGIFVFLVMLAVFNSAIHRLVEWAPKAGAMESTVNANTR